MAPPAAASDSPTKSNATSTLPPLALVFCVLTCSSLLFILSLRDFWTTGKNLYGPHDEAYLLFMKSTDWYDDAKGWKSTQGGFSAVQPVSTDRNNMGGFFMRKLMGAAGCAVQLHKLLPLLLFDASWPQGHYRPLLGTAVAANVLQALFLLSYWEDLAAARAQVVPAVMILLLLVEAVVLLAFLLLQGAAPRLPAVRLPAGKTPQSPVSNIVTRTVLIVTTSLTLVSLRDLVFPGRILEFLPGDDLFLEWTNALYHSPPPNSPEAADHGMEAPLYIGDRYVSQCAALSILILCLYKYVSAVGIRLGATDRGRRQAVLLWQCAALGDVCLLLPVRLFSAAARTASVDLRYHLMLLAYEAFILGLYGFF